MAVIKSFSVGNGDMFCISHNSNSFTLIDCNITENFGEEFIEEIVKRRKNKCIFRFISTHPDRDHISGLKKLTEYLDFPNFYCVENTVSKHEGEDDFKKYYELRNSTRRYLCKNYKCKYLNWGDNDIGSSGLSILWPVLENEDFKKALEVANDNGRTNNISPIIQYSLEDFGKVLWFGDLESSFLEKIANEINWEKTNIVFAPHHGRYSGKIPKEILDKLNPDIIVIGEAPSDDLEYYNNYNTITQNTAGTIMFDCNVGCVNVFVSNENYSIDFLEDLSLDNNSDFQELTYKGTLYTELEDC